MPRLDITKKKTSEKEASGDGDGFEAIASVDVGESTSLNMQRKSPRMARMKSKVAGTKKKTSNAATSISEEPPILQFCENSYIDIHQTLKSIKVNSTPHDDLRYCPNRLGHQKKGRPKKDKRKVKQSAKRSTGQLKPPKLQRKRELIWKVRTQKMGRRVKFSEWDVLGCNLG
jgi:hypothetical protein